MFYTIQGRLHLMLNKNEKAKTGIMTALIVFAAIGLFTIVITPDGIVSPAQALRSQTPGGTLGGGGVGSGSPCTTVTTCAVHP